MDYINHSSKIIACDIGASSCDPTPHIDNLLKNTNSKLYGFEPNKIEFEKLISENKDKKREFFNYAIGDGEEKLFNICEYPGWSSFLEADIDYVKNFHRFELDAVIKEKIKIKTKKLDEIKFESKLDFLKIDVQGLESEIIECSKDTIKNCLVVELELSPIPLYKKEKRFSYVCKQMEDLKFNLNMFQKINTKTFKPVILGGSSLNGLHTLIQLDCVFVPSYETINKLKSEDLKKLINIMHYSYHSYDFADFLIRLLEKKENIKIVEKYRDDVAKLKILKKY